jgi:polysaccharide biosynthesis/export protein
MKRTCLLIFLVLLIASPSRCEDELHHRPRYTLHPGDVIELQYRYTPELNQTVTVQPDGYVNLNLVGDVHVGDLTVQQAHDTILARAEQHLNAPELNLILKEFQAPSVVVAGEVGKPGTITVKENITAMQAILMSGGFLESAQTSQVLLFRKVNSDIAEIHVLNLKHFRKTSDLEHDIELHPGDMLYVPRDKLQKVSRYIKALNLGIYFNPLQTVP